MRIPSGRAGIRWWTWRVVLVLLLGILLTWLSAWYLALFPKKLWGGSIQQTHRGWYLDKQGRRMTFSFTAGGPSAGYSDFSFGDYKQYHAFSEALGTTPGLVFENECTEDDSFGIPLRSMGYRGSGVTRRQAGRYLERKWEVESNWEWRGQLSIRSSTAKRWGYPWGPPGGAVALPVHLLWPGFALDCLFYGGSLFLLIYGPSIARRRLRWRRGQCVDCGYELRGTVSGRCPECGLPIPEPQVAVIKALPTDGLPRPSSRTPYVLIALAGILVLAVLVSLRVCFYASVLGWGVTLSDGSVRIFSCDPRIPNATYGVMAEKSQHFPVLPWLYRQRGAGVPAHVVIPLVWVVSILGIAAARLFWKRR